MGTRALVIHPRLKNEEETGEGARDPDARLEEAVGLTSAIDLHAAHAEVVTVAKPRPGSLLGSGQIERLAQLVEALEIEVVVVDRPSDPGPAAQPRKGPQVQGHRPHPADPGDLRRPRAHPRGSAPGRSGVPDLPALAAGAVLDAPRAAARRHRVHGRPGRKPARNRPPTDRRPHHPDPPRAGGGQAHPGTAPRRPSPRAVPGGCAGGLHQRRQVDAVQPPVGRLGGRRGPAVRDPRPDHAAHRTAGRPHHHPLRHRRFHLRPSHPSGRRLPGHAGGSHRGRRGRARPRHRPSRQHRAEIRRHGGARRPRHRRDQSTGADARGARTRSTGFRTTSASR